MYVCWVSSLSVLALLLLLLLMFLFFSYFVVWNTESQAADNKYVVQIFSTGQSDISLWYRMWEAVTAVFSICVRAGIGGVITGLGEFYPTFSETLSLPPLRERREKVADASLHQAIWAIFF